MPGGTKGHLQRVSPGVLTAPSQTKHSQQDMGLVSIGEGGKKLPEGTLVHVSSLPAAPELSGKTLNCL